MKERDLSCFGLVSAACAMLAVIPFQIFAWAGVLSRLQWLLVLEQAAGMPKVVLCVCTAGVDWLKLIWNSRMVRSRLCENVLLPHQRYV